MSDKQKTRPRTRKTLDLLEGDIVWDDAKGWGIVLGTDATCRFSRVDTRNEFPDRFDHRDCRLVSWPDAEEVEAAPVPLRKVLEPVKLFGPIERSIERVQDLLAIAVEVGYAGLLREDGPRSFRLAWALKVWRCDALLANTLRRFPEWIQRVLTPVVEGSGWGRYSRFRRRSDFLVGLLASDRSVLARLVAVAVAGDLDEALARRRESDAEELLDSLTEGLEQAATARGIAGAERRYRSRLLALQRQHGRDKDFWGVQRQTAESLVRKRRKLT